MKKMLWTAALSAALLAMSSAPFAAGGPSGPKVAYQAQGHLGTVVVNPYKIAPLTAVIKNGGYTVENAKVRIVPKKGGVEIAYPVSNRRLLTHGGIPVFGLYPDYVNTVEVTYDRLHNGKRETFTDTYKQDLRLGRRHAGERQLRSNARVLRRGSEARRSEV